MQVSLSNHSMSYMNVIKNCYFYVITVETMLVNVHIRGHIQFIKAIDPEAVIVITGGPLLIVNLFIVLYLIERSLPIEERQGAKYVTHNFAAREGLASVFISVQLLGDVLKLLHEKNT